MKRASFVFCTCLFLACGSDDRKGFDEKNAPGGPGPTAGSDNGFEEGKGGGGTPLSCKGLNEGTKSSAGCDYYAVTPDVIMDGAGACHAAFIVNTFNEPVTLNVEYAGQTLDVSKFAYIPKGTGQATSYTPIGAGGQIPAGEVAILFLNRKAGGGNGTPFPFPGAGIGLNFDCPKGVTPAITDKDAASHGTSLGKAFHIATSAAVAAYDIYPYGGGQSALTSATLLLPTTSWDTNYIAVDAYGEGMAPGGQPFVQIVARQDNTEITILPTNDIAGGPNIGASKKGQPATYRIAKGEVLQLTQNKSLMGSVIQSNVPVGVWGGKSGLGIKACCDDSGHQQIPPVRALGSEYVLVRYRNRYDGQEETPPWRLVGAVDGTQLTWKPGVPTGAPTTLNRGQIVEFEAAGPFDVKAQDDKHPFYVSAHMTGAGVYDKDETDGRGDAEFVNVVPPGEFLPKYTFFTDPTYPETNLIVVRAKGKDGKFADVNLDCAGKLGGWLSVGDDFEYTRIDLVRGNFQAQGNCNNGRHVIESTNPFGLTVWGWGSAATGSMGSGFYSQYVSYAYPGGANVEPINDVVIPPVVK